MYGYLKNTHNIKYIDADLAASTGVLQNMNYRFPASGNSSANQRSQTNLDTARDATSSTTEISMASSNFVQNYAGSVMSRVVPQGSSSPTFSYTIYNGIINSFDSSGITDTVTSINLKMQSGLTRSGIGWPTDISIILLKSNSSIDNDENDYNDLVGHTSGWDASDVTEYSGELTVTNTTIAENTFALNSDARSDLQSLSEFQFIIYEFDEGYNGTLHTGPSSGFGHSRIFKGYSPSSTTTANRPFLEYEVSSASGYTHKVLGVAAGSIGKIKGVATANIGKVIGVD